MCICTCKKCILHTINTLVVSRNVIRKEYYTIPSQVQYKPNKSLKV